jgi:hypothetical protein
MIGESSTGDINLAFEQRTDELSHLSEGRFLAVNPTRDDTLFFCTDERTISRGGYFVKEQYCHNVSHSQLDELQRQEKPDPVVSETERFCYKLLQIFSYQRATNMQ